MRSGVTLEQVREIVGKLKAENRPISAATVRNELKTGSYSTITQHLRVIKAEESQDERATLRNPPAPEALTSLISTVWHQALSSAKTYLAAENKMLLEDRDILERENAEISDRAEGVIKQLFETREALELSKTENEALSKTRAAYIAKIQALEVENSAHIATISQLRSSLSEANDAESEILKKLQLETAAVAAFKVENDLLRERNLELKESVSDYSKLLHEKARMEAQNELLQEQLFTAKEQIAEAIKKSVKKNKSP